MFNTAVSSLVRHAQTVAVTPVRRGRLVSTDVQWRREGETTWHSGTPDCLQPGTEGHPVTLGVFYGYDAQVTDQSYSELAWIVC